MVEEIAIREHLLREGRIFVDAARRIQGVQRIGVAGSILTLKADPKDIDLLVWIDDDADLQSLAAAGRQLKGAAQQRNHGADIFLADARGKYLGRTCPWRVCQPGKRVACRARSCGARPYLYDDLGVVKLSKALTTNPPLEIWPAVVRRCEVPADVEALLVRARMVDVE
jgi:hypothetical protein